MLEIDKSGNWWLDGSIIEPWEITERWTVLVNAMVSMGDRQEELHDLICELYAVANLGFYGTMANAERKTRIVTNPTVLAIVEEK